MSKRRRKTPRTPEKKQQTVDNWLPGSGAPPDKHISLPQALERTLSSEERFFSKVASDQIRDEITFQEKHLAGLKKAFPRITTGTRAELNSTEEKADARAEQYQKTIELLRVELAFRGENQSTPVFLESEAALEEGRSRQDTRSSSAPKTSRNWYHSIPDTLRRRQIVLKNPEMSAKSLCKIFDSFVPPIPLPRDWLAGLGVKTWSEAYANPKGRNRVQKMISKDKRWENNTLGRDSALTFLPVLPSLNPTQGPRSRDHLCDTRNHVGHDSFQRSGRTPMLALRRGRRMSLHTLRTL